MSRGRWDADYRVQIQLPRQIQAWINRQRKEEAERHGNVPSVSEVIEAAIWKEMGR